MVAGIMRSAGRPLSSAARTGSNDRPTRRHEPRALVGDRLDLDDTALMAAKEPEVGIVASTDAHSVEDLEHMEHGVYQVRRAGLEARDVADTRTVAQFRMLLKR
jgi:histidinol phosphatase-like PHP family hydrolase